MKRKTLELLACPTCRGELDLRDTGDKETIESLFRTLRITTSALERQQGTSLASRS